MIASLSRLAVCVGFLCVVMTAAAQTSPPDKDPGRDLKQLCPRISVSCPADTSEGEPLTFTASVEQANPDVFPIYNWTVSAGKIIQGQGTPSITVDTVGSGGHSFTATVSVTGFDLACPATASCSLLSERNMVPPSRRFGSYGARPRRIEIAQLKAFAGELGNNPGALGYLMAYGGRRGRSGEAQSAATRAKEYLVNTHGLAAGRIVAVGAGFRETLTIELWIAPSGAMPPVADPTVDPSTIKVSPKRLTP